MHDTSLKIHFYFNENLFDVGPPPKPNSLLYELIPWISIIWNYGIWSTLISKHFKIREVMKVAYRREMAASFIKNRILEPKEDLRMKDEEIEIIWKSEFIKLFTKWSSRNSFSKTEKGEWEKMTRDSSVACQKVTIEPTRNQWCCTKSLMVKTPLR